MAGPVPVARRVTLPEPAMAVGFHSKEKVPSSLRAVVPMGFHAPSAMRYSKVTLVTEGHPVELVERYACITVAPIVIEEDVWIGAAATVLPGVTIGRGAVVGAGAVVAKDVPAMTVVTGPGHVVRRHLDPLPAPEV